MESDRRDDNASGPDRQALRSVRSRLVYRYGFALLKWIERVIENASTVGNTNFFDPNVYPWAARLESRWLDIRDEFDRVMSHERLVPDIRAISPHQSAITKDDRWRAFFLYGMGYRADANCLRCPRTAALLDNIPGLSTAMFSVLSPHKHLPAHRGAYKGLLTYHLGLRIPEPETICRIRVGDEHRHWHEGQGILFDDSIEHEVWNDSEEMRVVLLLQVERPLRFPASVFSKILLGLIKRTSYVQDARRNQANWEAQVGAQVDRNAFDS